MRITHSLLTLLLAAAGLAACAPNSSTSPASTAAAAQPASGGADGGGGDLPISSESEVRSVVARVMTDSLKHALYNMALGQPEIDDAYVIEVLESFFNDQVGAKDWTKSQPVFNDIAATKYYFETSSGCVDDKGSQHAAGVASRTIGAKICFSIPRLRTIPKEDLATEILALAAHEFTHHFGFGEIEAVKMQTFVAHLPKQVVYFGGKDFFVQFAKPMFFKAPSSLGKNADVTFQTNYVISDGNISELKPFEAIKLPNEKTPHCQFEIRWDDGNPVDATLREGRVQVEVTNIAAHSSSDGDSGIDMVNFAVNAVFKDGFMQSTGMSLVDANGHRAVGKIRGFFCSGNDLHVMDLKLIFGSYGALPQLF